jgi:predicted DCC family thiol-disulfide oxidoreductase YuxK
MSDKSQSCKTNATESADGHALLPVTFCKNSTYLVYDGDCPVCSAYVRVTRLRESVGKVDVVNARDGGAVVDKIVTEGLDLDEGMVLWYGGRFYHGADCIHMMALMSSPSGLFNRINAAIFRSPVVARRLYPVLRFGRNLLLKIIGRSPLALQSK